MQANAKVEVTVLDNLNLDEIIDQYADMLGVAPDLITASDQVAIIRKGRADAQKAAAQAAAVNQAAQTANTLGKTPTNPNDPNALTDMISQFSGYGGPGQAVAA
jgi:hypothetical protein